MITAAIRAHRSASRSLSAFSASSPPRSVDPAPSPHRRPRERGDPAPSPHRRPQRTWDPASSPHRRPRAGGDPAPFVGPSETPSRWVPAFAGTMERAAGQRDNSNSPAASSLSASANEIPAPLSPRSPFRADFDSPRNGIRTCARAQRKSLHAVSGAAAAGSSQRFFRL
jgi:hypothetical protein